MNLRTTLKKNILLALNAANGEAFPESALYAAAKNLSAPLQPTLADFTDALADLAADRFAAGVTDDFSNERTWSLTTKGQHQARQLR